MKYLLLQNPGHNRVYYNLADKLALAELTLAAQNLSVSCHTIQIENIEGIRYLTFQTEKTLDSNDMEIISRMSFVFAIFQSEMHQKKCLIPIRKVNYQYVEEKIGSILKYQGKTNELFTKMMINIALLASDFSQFDQIQLLDPVAGKGTTLLEGTVYGFNVYGIEIEQKPVHELVLFFKKFLEVERLKHTYIKRQISGAKKSNAINIHEFEYSKTKDDFKDTSKLKQFGIINGKSQDAFSYFKKETFHLIVGDLPYGIFHGSSGAKKHTSGTKNPSAFLQESLAGWKKVLYKGGTIVLAWNSYIVNRQKLAEIFTNNGFSVFSQSPYDGFEHMVDKSIKRDLIVAKKI